MIALILVSLCELTAHPEAYDGKMVRVAGVYVAGFEAARLEDARRCADQEVWVEFSPAYERETAPRMLRRWNRAFATSEDRCSGVSYSPSFRVNVTFVGLFETKKDRRFGHLSRYEHKLTVQSIERVGRGGEIVANPAPPAYTFTIDCGMMNRLPLP